MKTFDKLREKLRCSTLKKSNGDGNLLVASILVVVGVAVASVIIMMINDTGTMIQTNLNNRVQQTQVANTWIK